MPITPGAPATFSITLVAEDTFEPLPGQPVELRLFDPAIGGLRPVAKGITDSTGRAVIPFTLPTAEGKYRFASFFPGTPEFKPDTSPELAIEIKR